MSKKVFRGVDKFYVAKIISDTKDGLIYDVPYQVAGVQHVVREVSEESAKVAADNKTALIIKGAASSTATFTTLCLDPAELAKLLGHKTIGAAMVATNRAEDVYFGIMYRMKYSDGTYNYVALSKGKFLAPGEDIETESEGTDTTLQELAVELSQPEYEFTVDGVKASFDYLQLKEDAGENFEDAFFAEMQTPDTIKTVGGQVASPVATEGTDGSIVLTCDTVGATIYYTTDGTDPSATNGTVYEVPVVVDETVSAIKAIAVKGNYEDSEIVEVA